MPNRRACKASGWVPGRLPARAQFGQALHGPDVVFVTQGPEEAFPERLLPADAPGAGLELRGLALQAHVRGLVEQVQQLRGRHGAQRGAAFAAQFLRQRLRRLAAEPEAELAQRGIERRGAAQEWAALRRPAARSPRSRAG